MQFALYFCFGICYNLYDDKAILIIDDTFTWDLLIANAQNIVSKNEGIVPDWVIKNGVKNIVWDDTITADETAREVAEYFGLLE